MQPVATRRKRDRRENGSNRRIGNDWQPVASSKRDPAYIPLRLPTKQRGIPRSFEGRADYAAIGTVTNLAARLADEAAAGQILIAQRLYAEVEDDVEVEPAGEFMLKGFRRPVAAFNVLAVRETAGELSQS